MYTGKYEIWYELVDLFLGSLISDIVSWFCQNISQISYLASWFTRIFTRFLPDFLLGIMICKIFTRFFPDFLLGLWSPTVKEANVIINQCTSKHHTRDKNNGNFTARLSQWSSFFSCFLVLSQGMDPWIILSERSCRFLPSNIINLWGLTWPGLIMSSKSRLSGIGSWSSWSWWILIRMLPQPGAGRFRVSKGSATCIYI